MALSTGCCSVLACQLEARICVIERGRLPAVGGVAFSTLRAKPALMRIGITVTGGAVHGRTFENAVDMAAFTGYGLMFTGQLEGRIIVIERGRFPATGRMADRALITKRAIMRVIIGMAGGTVHGSAFEDTVDMTVLAGNRGMLPIQFECELGMIYLGQLPAIGGVACGTFGPKLTVVMVILQVAGDTRLRSCFQVGDRAGIDVALGAGHRSMLAAQFERYRVMVKVRTK